VTLSIISSVGTSPMVHQNFHIIVQLRRERRITLVVGRRCQQSWPENQASTATSRHYRASQFVRLTYNRITISHILHDRKLHMCNASHTPTATGRQPSAPPWRKNIARSTTQPLHGHSDVTTLQSKLLPSPCTKIPHHFAIVQKTNYSARRK